MKQFVNHCLSYFGLQFVSVAKAAGGAAVQAAVPAAEAAAARCIEEDKAKLLELLNHDNYRFRTLAKLASAINSDGDLEYVKGLLRSVGARKAYRNDGLWGLKSVVGDRA